MTVSTQALVATHDKCQGVFGSHMYVVYVTTVMYERRIALQWQTIMCFFEHHVHDHLFHLPDHSTNGTFFTSNDKANKLESVIVQIWNSVIRKVAYKDKDGNPVYNKDTELHLEHVLLKNVKTKTDKTWDQVGNMIVTAISENNAALQAQIDSNQSRWDSAMLKKTNEFTEKLGRIEAKHAKDAEIWALDLANQNNEETRIPPQHGTPLHSGTPCTRSPAHRVVLETRRHAHVSVLSESGRMTGSLRRHGHALDVGGAGEIRSAQARRRGADAPRRERARG